MQSDESTSIVWRWDGTKFDGVTNRETPIESSEGGFAIATSGAETSLLISIGTEGSAQQYALIGSSQSRNSSVLYKVRHDSVQGKPHSISSCNLTNLVLTEFWFIFDALRDDGAEICCI